MYLEVKRRLEHAFCFIKTKIMRGKGLKRKAKIKYIEYFIFAVQNKIPCKKEALKRDAELKYIEDALCDAQYKICREEEAFATDREFGGTRRNTKFKRYQYQTNF